jgi:hypothetical protein
VMCGGCNTMVHAFNNECMTDWVEWSQLALCWPCTVQAFRKHAVHFEDFKQAASKFPCINGD